MDQVFAVGIDWSDDHHDICVLDQTGQTVLQRSFEETAEGFADLGRILDEWSANGIELVGCIEKPEGRIVDLLLDHQIKLYPINPKSLQEARKIHRVSGSKSDPFDAFVLADHIRTHYTTLRPLMPNSPEMAELKMLTRDYDQQVRHQTRMVSQLRVTLKAYYPRVLEAFDDLTSPACRDFLTQYPTPQDLEKLTRRRLETLCKRHRLWKKTVDELWQKLKAGPQLLVPEHVVRAKTLSVQTLLRELDVVVSAVEQYRESIERFFVDLPVAPIAKSLPGGKSGVMIPSLWAEVGDAERRWESFRHLQACGGDVPITRQSGKHKGVYFRFACNKRMRYHSTWLAQCSLKESTWARDYYDAQKARGKSHRQALRALAAKWLKIIYFMWRDQVPYDENRHLANLYRQQKKATIKA